MELKVSTADWDQMNRRRFLRRSLLALAAAQWARAMVAPGFPAGVVLGRPTATSITANLIPPRTMQVSYEYGLQAGVYTRQTAVQTAVGGEPLETVLEGLVANTRYYYRLRYDDQVSAEGSFHTQRTPGTPFMFAIQGDSHPERVNKQFDARLYGITLGSVAAARPDFFVAIGDDFSVDTLKTINAQTVKGVYQFQRPYLARVGAPVFLVNGNHEQASLANLDGTPNNVAVLAQNWRNAYYPQPAPDGFYSGNAQPVEHIGLLRNYYAWTWGDALFVVIDPYWHSAQAVDNGFGDERSAGKKRDIWNNTLGEVQYRWFRQVLETSQARYRIVMTHHVNGTGRGGIELAGTGEWGDTRQFAAKRPGWEQPIHEVMVRNGVNIFFQGHDHVFVHQELDGVVYQTLPQPANPNYNLDNEDAYRSGTKLPNSGHLRVMVDPVAGITVSYLRSYLEKPDEVAYSYTVRARR